MDFSKIVKIVFKILLGIFKTVYNKPLHQLFCTYLGKQVASNIVLMNSSFVGTREY